MKKKIVKTDKIGLSQKAFIFNKDGKFLTIRRTKTAPTNPLKWDLPGGDIEIGEDPKKSMLREIKEETGFVASGLIPFDVEAYTYPGENYWVTIAYMTSNPKGKMLISWEHDLHKWVTVDEFLKLKIPTKLRKFAKKLKTL
jgi:8-oxo-dGTP pyrophosphatase MutT (NUDIX family)